MGHNREEETVTRGDRERASNRLWRAIFWLFLIVFLTVGATMHDAEAGYLRCGQDLVNPGDSYLDVTDACGEPDREVTLVGEDDQRVGTALYYRGGYGQADRRVYLLGGTVTGIERLN